MKYIDTEGKGHTLLILTDAESRLIRRELELEAEIAAGDPLRPIPAQALAAWRRGIQRGTDKMTEESKAEWKARKK